MIKYRTWYDTRIEEIEVVHETTCFVTVEETPQWTRRDAKRSDNGYNYFDTWAEARQFLIDREKDAIKGHQNDITRHQEALQKIEAMTR